MAGVSVFLCDQCCTFLFHLEDNPFHSTKKWHDTTWQLLYLKQQCRVFLRILSKGIAYTMNYPCLVTNYQLNILYWNEAFNRISNKCVCAMKIHCSSKQFYARTKCQLKSLPVLKSNKIIFLINNLPPLLMGFIR